MTDREEFEAWLEADVILFDQGIVNAMWDAWQAARSAPWNMAEPDRWKGLHPASAAFLKAWNLIVEKCEFTEDQGPFDAGWRSSELESAWNTVQRGIVSILVSATAAQVDAERYRKARSNPDRRPAAWYTAGGRKIWGAELDRYLDGTDSEVSAESEIEVMKAVAYATVTRDRRFCIIWEPDTLPGEYRLYAGPNQCTDEYKLAYQEGHFDGYQDGWQASDDAISNTDSFNPPEHC